MIPEAPPPARLDREEGGRQSGTVASADLQWDGIAGGLIPDVAEEAPAVARGDERRQLVALFAPDFTEISTIFHARSFQDNGLDVVVFAFRRARYNQNFKAPWQEIELGRTADARYFDRMVKLVGALPVLWRHRALLRRAAVLCGRNIDQLLLIVIARLCMGARGRLVYEVLDIAGIFTARGPLATFMRWMERRLLGMTDAVVVSSAGFEREYFRRRQGYRGRVQVIENRLHREDVAVLEREPETPPEPLLSREGYKWVIGYFGLIRGRATFDLMKEVAARCPDVLFYLRGILTTIEPEYLEAMLQEHPNIVFGGDYVNPDDLRQLYEAVDFTWAIDLEREHTNSRWLMPCRLFESSFLGVPCLAIRGFEVGERIEALGLGWTVSSPRAELLEKLLEDLSREEYEGVVARLKAMPRSYFLDGEDFAALCNALKMPVMGSLSVHR